MRDILPPEVLEQIGRQYFNSVREAEPGFQNYQADEDSITGALGNSMDRMVKGSYRAGTFHYTWKTRTVKLRGRGHGAPEKEYGADAILELEVCDGAGNTVGRKVLPFQAKKAGRINSQSLCDQSRRLNRLPGGGLVVVFGPEGYECTSAKEVLAVDGTWGQVRPEQRHDFATIVQTRFLECTVGSRSLYFDAERERMVMLERDGTSRDIRFTVRRRTRTIIRHIGY
jgi:hypothetical protein